MFLEEKMESRRPNGGFTVIDVYYGNIRISSQQIALQSNTLPQLGEIGRKYGLSLQKQVFLLQARKNSWWKFFVRDER